MALYGNCNVKIHSDSMGKLTPDEVVWFTRIRKADECNLFSFKHSAVTNGDALHSHRMKDKPDEIICGIDKCDMTGTLTVTPSADATNDKTGDENTKPTNVTSEVNRAGEPFQFGYTQLLLKGNKGDKFEITLHQSNDEANGNKYTVTLNEDGWNRIILQNFKPDEIVGSGWTGTDEGFQITTHPLQNKEFGMSTGELIEDAYQFIQTQSFGFTCLTDFSGDPELTITEDACDLPTYDPTQTTIERSLEASKMIGDFNDFGGLTTKLADSKFTIRRTGKFTAKSETIDGTKYGVVNIPDLADGACLNFFVQPQDCDYTSLSYMNVDGSVKNVDVPDDMFFRDGNKLYFNEAYEGMEFVIAYPTEATGTAYDMNVNELNRGHYRMEAELPLGKKRMVIQADNVLLTSLPLTWTNEAGTFTVEYTMARDENGSYGRQYVLDNE